MRNILIDTDPGQDIDDLLAIIFALRRPEICVKAVTTVTYPSDRRARLVKRLLRYLNRTDIPVAAGMQYPLRVVGEREQAQLRDDRHSMNHASFAEPADERDAPGDDDAVDLIIRTVQANPGIMLACIAPLTNIACALCREPGIAKNISSIALMGGDVAQNRTEHNIAFDCIAADLVLQSGIPIYMGTWDVTRKFVLLKDDCALFAASDQPVCRALAEAIAVWNPVHSWKPGPVMYDLFPMIWAFNRTLYTMKEMPVRVEITGENSRGMTIPIGNQKNIFVSTDIDVPAVREMYLSTVLGGR
ncbi:MAG: nucleoside hydrolase [Spirochaetes bacterium]|nr:nucleoside hydrolase [Spirochaetota bacterium]